MCSAKWHRDKFVYDWCHTSENCGEHHVIDGWWDKCLYLDSSKPDYVALGWKEKQEQMWSHIMADNSTAPYLHLASIFNESMKTSFDNEWDVMPAGRKKLAHPVGSVCPFVVNIVDSPFTGIFQTGEAHGLIRLGSGVPIDEKSGVFTGGGVKFFRTGRSSANFVILNKFGPMADNIYNFFAVSLSNHVQDDIAPALIPLVTKSCEASSCPTKVGISDVCRYDQEGNEAEKVVFPFKVNYFITQQQNAKPSNSFHVLIEAKQSYFYLR